MCIWVCNGKYRCCRKRENRKSSYGKGYRAVAKSNADTKTNPYSYAKSESKSDTNTVAKSNTDANTVADPYSVTNAKSVANTDSAITNTGAYSAFTDSAAGFTLI